MVKKLFSKKILIIAPAFKEWDLGSFIKNLLSGKGVRCNVFAYGQFLSQEKANAELLKKVRNYKPDIVLGLKLDRIYVETLRRIRRQGFFCALWYVDCFEESIPEWIKPLFKEVDVFFTTAKGMLPKYEQLGDTPAYWNYEGAFLPAFPDLKLTEPLKNTYASQVAFVGNIFQPPVADKNIAMRRQSLLKKVNDKYQLKIWGVQGDPLARKKWGPSRCPVIEWPAYNEELVKVCRASDIILGINTVNTIELYFSNRTFITLASGGFHLTEYVPGLETLFDNHKHLAWYDSDKECLDLISYYLKRPSLRRKIAKEGRGLVRSKYSMKMQLNKILGIIGKHYDA